MEALRALQQRTDKMNEHLGRMEVLKECLQLVVRHKDTLPQPFLDDIMTFTDSVRSRGPA